MQVVDLMSGKLAGSPWAHNLCSPQQQLVVVCKGVCMQERAFWCIWLK